MLPPSENTIPIIKRRQYDRISVLAFSANRAKQKKKPLTRYAIDDIAVVALIQIGRYHGVNNGWFIVLGHGQAITCARAELGCMIVDVGDVHNNGCHIHLSFLIVRCAAAAVDRPFSHRIWCGSRGCYINWHRVHVCQLTVKLTARCNNAAHRIDRKVIVGNASRNFIRQIAACMRELNTKIGYQIFSKFLYEFVQQSTRIVLALN